MKEFFPQFPVVIKELRIPAVAPPPKKRVLHKTFLEAFPKNHSRLHGYLKWFGANWASWDFVNECRYETRYLIPHAVESALLQGRKISPAPQGHVFEPKEDVYALLRRCIDKVQDLSEADLSFPIIKPVDVYSIGTVVECGETDISDLLLPIASRIVRQVLWIPYPKNRDLDSDWVNFSDPVYALLIYPQPASPSEMQRFVRRALRSLEVTEKSKRRSVIRRSMSS